MSKNNQDLTARRFDPNSFDCELPYGVRAELLRPKRPVILKRSPVYQPPDYSGILQLGCSVLVVMLLLVAAFTSRQPQSAPIAQPTPVPIVQPTPAQREQPLSPPPPVISAPRARLVLYKKWMGNGVWEVMDSTGRTVKILVDPAPRAQLVQRALAWQPGQARIMRMPYDESFEVRGVLKGYLAEVGQLPRSGNVIGDTWIVGRTPWVWVTVPGTSAPIWADP